MRKLKLLLFLFLFSCSYKLDLYYEPGKKMSYCKYQKGSVAIVPFLDARLSRDIDPIFVKEELDVPKQMENLFIRDLKNENLFKEVHYLDAKNLNKSDYINLAKTLKCQYIIFTKINKFEEKLKVPAFKKYTPIILGLMLGIFQGLQAAQSSYGNTSSSSLGEALLGFVLVMALLGGSMASASTHSPVVSLDIELVDVEIDKTIFNETFETSFSKKDRGKVEPGIFLVEALKITYENVNKKLNEVLCKKE